MGPDNDDAEGPGLSMSVTTVSQPRRLRGSSLERPTPRTVSAWRNTGGRAGHYGALQRRREQGARSLCDALGRLREAVDVLTRCAERGVAARFDEGDVKQPPRDVRLFKGSRVLRHLRLCFRCSRRLDFRRSYAVGALVARTILQSFLTKSYCQRPPSLVPTKGPLDGVV